MRYSQLFLRTLRAAPSNVTRLSEQLAVRAGLLRKLDAGEYAFLPLGARVLARWQARARAYLHAQEILLPNPTAIRDVARGVQSFRDLPAILYACPAPPPALDLFVFHRFPLSASALEVDTALQRILADAQLPIRITFDSSAWLAESPRGDARFLFCPACGATALEEFAPRAPDAPSSDALLPVEEVETPHCATIESLAQFLNIPTRQTAKAMFYVADDQLLFAVLRGDLAVSEAKLVRALGISKLRFATDDEIRWVGAVPGYASPVGLQRVRVVADESIVAARNLVAGANRAGYHLKNTNVPRDYQPERVVDFAQVRAGDSCWHCGKPLEAGAGFVVVSAQVIADEQQDEFKYLDENGRAAPFGIAHWRLDLHAAFLALLDAHHDDKGILFPPALAPFDVHLVALNADKPEVVQAIARLHDELEARGIAVLCDDRLESAGVKFNDADLIGVPLRVTVGPRTLAQESAEIKLRAEKEARIVRLDQVVSEIRHSPFATRHSQFATRHSPFATRHSPFATRHP